MIRLLLRKLLPYRSFWRFEALHIGGILFLIFGTSQCHIVGFSGDNFPVDLWLRFPQVWGASCGLAHWLFYIPAFFVVQIVCAELELKLVRAQVIAGLERRSIVLGWVLQNTLLAVLGTVAVAAAALSVGKVVDTGYGLDAAVAPLAGFFLYGLIFLNFTLLSAVVMRRPLPALATVFIWPLVVEGSLGAMLQRYELQTWKPYLPFAAAASLVPMPVFGEVFLPGAPTTLAAAFFGILAAYLAWFRLARMDL